MPGIGQERRLHPRSVEVLPDAVGEACRQSGVRLRVREVLGAVQDRASANGALALPNKVGPKSHRVVEGRSAPASCGRKEAPREEGLEQAFLPHREGAGAAAEPAGRVEVWLGIEMCQMSMAPRSSDPTKFGRV